MYDYDYLAHFGIKGMRWGVRKSRDKKRRGFRKQYTKEEVLASKNPKVVYKNMDLLTDDELRKKLNRMQLENNMYNYAHPSKSVRKQVRQSFANEFVKSLAKPAGAVAASVLLVYGYKLVNGKFPSSTPQAKKGESVVKAILNGAVDSTVSKMIGGTTSKKGAEAVKNVVASVAKPGEARKVLPK